MAIIRPAQITNDAFSVWANSIQDGLNERNLSISSDFIQTSGPTGKFLSLHPNNKYTSNYMNYVGEWHPTASYKPGDVVRVLPGRDYFGKGGSNPHSIPWKIPPVSIKYQSNMYPYPLIIPVGSQMYGSNVQFQVAGQTLTTAVTLPYYTAMPGSYVCISNVPSMEMDIIYGKMNTSDLPHAPLSANTPNILNAKETALVQTLRLIDVNYYPVWPEKHNVAYIDSTNLIAADGRYWDLISLLPTQTVSCKSGRTTITYTDTESPPSGSVNYTVSYGIND